MALTREESNELQELLIENSSVSVIKSDMFVNFPNIQILRLRNASIQTVEEGAFQDLLNLKKVYLTDNYLEVLNSNVFPSNNSIRILDLSRNLLNNLDDFDLEPFPLLTIMNVSHNRLEYLPDNIMNKLNESNNFYLIVDNNPWNCLHPKWVLRLTEILVEAFCTNKSYDPTEMDIKVEKLTNPEYKNGTKNEATPEQNSFYCLKYSLKSCLMWAFGAVWVGVILGNMCKLKRMLFTQPRRYEDKNTQCGKLWNRNVIKCFVEMIQTLR